MWIFVFFCLKYQPMRFVFIETQPIRRWEMEAGEGSGGVGGVGGVFNLVGGLLIKNCQEQIVR
jgi:hypothetical protein